MGTLVQARRSRPAGERVFDLIAVGLLLVAWWSLGRKLFLGWPVAAANAEHGTLAASVEVYIPFLVLTAGLVVGAGLVLTARIQMAPVVLAGAVVVGLFALWVSDRTYLDDLSGLTDTTRWVVQLAAGAGVMAILAWAVVWSTPD